MKAPGSIRGRLASGAAVIVVLFLGAAGAALQQANGEAVRAAHYARLQGAVYLVLGAADIAPDGRLVMQPSIAEARLTTPSSGLYAAIFKPDGQELWRSASTPGSELPFPRSAPVGEWRYDEVSGGGHGYLAASYAVRWAAPNATVPLVLSVMEDEVAMRRELGAFNRTLWSWLGALGVLLVLSQAALLRWGLAPLKRVAREIGRIESGAQPRIEGDYPREITRLTDNINALVERERSRQQRYREALSFLAHSLKTPLAVLRAAEDDPAQLPETVRREVSRMDGIVQHQLARAAAGSGARYTAPLALLPVVERIRASLQKVHADKGLAFDLRCDPALDWPIEEGDAFELLGNLMDNAAKWAAHSVRVQIAREQRRLHIRVEDDGPGFGDTGDLLRIHVRGDEQVPGHGVGLAIVNELVTSQGGDLVLANVPGGGGRVDIDLRSVQEPFMG